MPLVPPSLHRNTDRLARTPDSSETSRDRALRSANMSRIRGTNTTPELRLRKALWNKGIRYRLHVRVEGTRPDLVFASRRLVVFVDGCFWHGCPQHYVRPRSRSDFWADKLAVNTSRDRSQTTRLMEKGWSVLRFWEHEIDSDLERVVAEVALAHMAPNVEFRSRSIVVRVAATSANTEEWRIEDLLDSNTTSSETRPRRPISRGKHSRGEQD